MDASANPRRPRAIAESSGNAAEADRQFRAGVALLEVTYPGSAALLNAKARLAGYLARAGQVAAAEAMFREIVQSQPDTSNLPPSFAFVLRPYVDLLLKKNDPAATAEIFAATQLMVRPGLAQTQAVLARELTGGTDEASRLFRQSVTLTRNIERARIELARLEESPNMAPEELIRANGLRSAVREAQRQQLATQAALASFPRYRAVSGQVLPLADLQKTLRPGEAYYRMTIVGDHIYAILVTPAAARAVKLEVTGKQLEEQVDALRETISTVENGQRTTYAFDVALSHQLYNELLSRSKRDVAGVKHLIFEPDGAMLRLPPNLLVMDQASVAAYQQRAAAGGDAEFDFRGVKWFGRDRDISTSVSPRSFAQLRAAPPSAGAKQYLGLGENSPPGGAAMIPAAADRDCVLPLSSWAQPISAQELRIAGGIFQGLDPNGVQIITRDQFTDTGLEARTDLDEYRILHFRDARRGHGARAEMRGAAGAADQLRRAGVGRAADLPRDFRPRSRRRPRHPVGVRHGRRGERCRDPVRRACAAAAMLRSTAWCAPSSAPAGGWWWRAIGRCRTTSRRPSG